MSKTASKALYRELVDEILAKLLSGQLSVGDRLPPETEYALSLGVSRSTVRLAFSHLEKAGVISRRKRGGTEIIATYPVQRFEMTTGGLNDVLTVSLATKFDLTNVRSVEASDFIELQNYTEESNLWLRCTGTRSMAGQTSPFVWSQIFVAERYSGISVRAGDSPVSIFDEVEKKYGAPVNRVNQRYSAMLCGSDVSVALGLQETDPVLTLFAELWDENGDLMQLAYSIFDPARFKVVTDVNIYGII